MASELAGKVEKLLQEAFPHYLIKKEYFVLYNGYKLFFDFYLPELLVAVEAQGGQHDKFVEHFHGDGFNFRAHKKRDKAKREWALENKVTLIEIRDKDFPMSVSNLIDTISDGK